MANLVELFDNIVQMQNLNGVPLANGKMYVYALGRTRLMDTWSDVDGESLNSNPIILDAAGQCHCYVSTDFDYTIVVCDAYDNEIFSIDKYLYSQGSHSHADVAVAPSETIAVSSYHVGETTVYVPYLTGQLGKTYEGISPIVVNNVEDKISAQHVPLGVQDPLYFVQDDEEGCIIGFSGQTIPEEVMSESALGFENNKITGYNGSAFSAGNEYEAGDNIDITNGVISGKDWSNEINDASAAATAWTDSQGYLTGVDLSEYAKESFVISAIDSSTSGLLSTSAFATASGSFITALPDDLATTGWVDSQGYLTAVDIPESAVWNATTQTVSANSAAWAGGTANPQIPVTGINGIKISESGDKVVFEVSADYYPGNNPSGFITGVDLSDYATTAQLAEKQDITGMTAYQPVGNYQTAGDYLTTADSANFYTTANESGFITGVDLTPYQEKADMTAYATVESLTAKQDAGDYLSATDSANFLLTSDSGNFYPMTANPSGYINELPEEEEVEFEELDISTYLQNTDLTITDGKVTEISGVPLSAGDEFPQSATDAIGYVTATSANIDSTIDNVSANSGVWGGSALPISAGPGIKFDMVDNTLVASTDETVLWTNSNPSQVSANVTLTGTLSESCSAFEILRFICKGSYDAGETFSGAVQAQDFYTNDSNIENRVGVYLANRHGQTIYRDTCQLSFKDTGFTANNGSRIQGLTGLSENKTRGPYILQIIGINRIAGGN